MNNITVTASKSSKTISSNQFSITGRLGQNAEVRHFDNCSKTNISIAVDEGGEKPSWYSVVLWNLSKKQNAVLNRGTKVTVTGEMRFENWTDKNTGEPRRAIKLHVNDKMALELHSRSRSNSAPAPAPMSTTQVATQQSIADEDWDSIAF